MYTSNIGLAIILCMYIEEQGVINLYVNEKLSVQKIAKSLGITQYRDQKILRENQVAKRTISEAITAHHITSFGAKEFNLKQELTHQDELLKMAGIMLYWGEGSKRGNSVDLSNSNPQIIKLFLQFLRIICGVAEERLRIALHYYEDHDRDELVEFWSRETGVPKKQFHKPWLHVRKKGTYKSPSLFGTVIVRYSDKRLKNLILQWIEESYVAYNNPTSIVENTVANYMRINDSNVAVDSKMSTCSS